MLASSAEHQYGLWVTESFAYMSLFRQHSDSFNPETLVVLESILDETWTALQANRKAFDEMKTRAAIADLIVKFAQQGERDPQKLKALVLAALPSYEAQQSGASQTLKDCPLGKPP